MSRANYIFVDYENVQETELERIVGKPVKLTLVLGKSHKNVPVKVAELMGQYPTQLRIAKSSRDGKNALDFVLACEVGAQAAVDLKGSFHIISKDKGFDSMIQHLKGHKIQSARHAALRQIPILMTPAERIAYVAKHLKDNKNWNPANREKLASWIRNRFSQTLTTKEVDTTIMGLVRKKVIKITKDGTVSALA